MPCAEDTILPEDETVPCAEGNKFYLRTKLCRVPNIQFYLRMKLCHVPNIQFYLRMNCAVCQIYNST